LAREALDRRTVWHSDWIADYGTRKNHPITAIRGLCVGPAFRRDSSALWIEVNGANAIPDFKAIEAFCLPDLEPRAALLDEVRVRSFIKKLDGCDVAAAHEIKPRAAMVRNWTICTARKSLD
jgi:hypothetical protein